MKKQQTQSGFTIIEVMIVLAIAGLIMVIALIAIPQLQRNQRNTSRRSIMSRISTEINNYASNNNGELPTGGGAATDATTGIEGGFRTRYLGSTVNIDDPQSGDPMNPVAQSNNADVPAVGVVNYKSGAKCNGEAVIDGTSREFALWTQLEGGSIYCLSNQ